MSSSTAPADQTGPRSRHDRVRFALTWFGSLAAIGLLWFFYHYLGELAEGNRPPFLKPLINEMTGVFGAGVLFFVVRRLVKVYPLDRRPRFRKVLVYLAWLPVLSVAHTSMNWSSRIFFYYLAGYGLYDYGIMPIRYAMEFPVDVMGYTLAIAALHGIRRLREARAQELRAAQLETTLAQAQLHNLRLQLQPHFLFNALNTISSTMYTDAVAADEMMDRLAELLRVSLKTTRSDEVPLRAEIELLDCYLSIMRARFGERLDVQLDVDPALENALVPSLMLQPLVENAIRHGNAERSGRGRIVVRARRDGEWLAIEVEDDGPGSPEGAPDQQVGGLGLAATAERLRLLYGDNHLFGAGNATERSGYLVQARLPLRLQSAA